MVALRFRVGHYGSGHDPGDSNVVAVVILVVDVFLASSEGRERVRRDDEGQVACCCT